MFAATERKNENLSIEYFVYDSPRTVRFLLYSRIGICLNVHNIVDDHK